MKVDWKIVYTCTWLGILVLLLRVVPKSSTVALPQIQIDVEIGDYELLDVKLWWIWMGIERNVEQWNKHEEWRDITWAGGINQEFFVENVSGPHKSTGQPGGLINCIRRAENLFLFTWIYYKIYLRFERTIKQQRCERFDPPCSVSQSVLKNQKPG